MTSNKIWFVKTLIVSFLLVMFLVFFGLPSVLKYFEQQADTFTVKSVEQRAGVPTPGVTLCNGLGWKNRTLWSRNFLEQMCTDAGNIHDCIDEKTFDFKDILKKAWKKSESLMDSKRWISDFTDTSKGKCFTFNSNELLTKEDGIILKFEDIFNFVFIHDPQYYVISSNPMAMPMIVTTLGNTTQAPILRLKVTKHFKLNLPSQPCEEDTSYNFQVFSGITGFLLVQACLKRSLSAKTGCRLKWDTWSSEEIPYCSTMDQFR